jgi:hypothetical protein
LTTTLLCAVTLHSLRHHVITNRDTRSLAFLGNLGPELRPSAGARRIPHGIRSLHVAWERDKHHDHPQADMRGVFQSPFALPLAAVQRLNARAMVACGVESLEQAMTFAAC